jgi:K(+)-stimulated pyrophosphate-energized sodium pump
MAPASCILINVFSVFLARHILRKPIRFKEITEISRIIKEGAIAYLNRQFTAVLIFGAILAVILELFFGALTAIAFSIGAIFSAVSAYIGTLIAVNTNSKAAEAVKEGFHKAFLTAFGGGMVTGLSLSSFGLLVVSVFYMLLLALGYNDPAKLVGLGFGASLVGLFARVGGGIYTKAADISADIVGKVEMGLREDDPSNPAVIADQVGDNVGDIAGTGSDIFQSYVCMLVAAIILGVAARGLEGAIYPLLVLGSGLFASATSLVSARLPIKSIRDLIYGIVYVPAIITSISSAFISQQLFGNLKAFLATLLGIVAALLLTHVTEYYTSPGSKPVKAIVESSKYGPAVNILTGFSTGLEAALSPTLIISVIILLAYYFEGLYGITLTAVGFLSIMGTFVSMAAYGPIVDNADGLIAMSGMSADLRRTMDTLDAIGNITKAICKVYAIGTSALAQIALFSTYLNSAHLSAINAADSKTIAGMLVGGSLSFILCSLVIRAVSKASNVMMEEIRRYFRKFKSPIQEKSGGKSKPAHVKCIEICTKAALRGMFCPAILSVVSPFAVAILLGAEALGGLVIGNLVTTLPLSLFMCVSGAAWDNAKKHIEMSGGEKGDPIHSASVIGDTVGDPLKDTAGPSLDIFINLIGTAALIYATHIV